MLPPSSLVSPLPLWGEKIFPAGGTDLETQPPVAGSLHRAGCKDGWASQQQEPLFFLLWNFSPFLHPALPLQQHEVLYISISYY